MGKYLSMLWQPIRPFEFTQPVFDYLIYRGLTIKPLSTLIFAHPRLRRWLTRREVNERVVEIPFVLANLPRRGKVLDVGACESPLALMLASLGYQVTALDLRSYPFDHPNLQVKVADITRWRSADQYDVIICLSTLEHILADSRAMANIWASLRPGGKLLLTTPAAVTPATYPGWRSYSVRQIRHLLAEFAIVKHWLGAKDDQQHWQLVPRLVSQPPKATTPTAVHLILARKK